MSGIAGLYSLSGIQIEDDQIQEMVSLLAHRGPDGSGIWTNKFLGLGHVLLHTTPESLFERQPYQDGPYCIIADARLDNREDLIREFNLNDSHRSQITDCQIILHAYSKWGYDCPGKLFGDFAFAIWDDNKGELFCARDVFGVKPFYYFSSTKWFIFASEIKSILCCHQYLSQPNEIWLVNFFLPNASFQDKHFTSYKDIYRLPPANSLRITPSGSYQTCYWSLNPEQSIRLNSDDEYAKVTRQHFFDAVRSRMRSSFPVGSSLSGGLDSSSIACTMRALSPDGHPPVHTFSAKFQDAPDADESEYIDAVTEMGGLIPHELHPDRQSPFIDLERVLWHMDEPFFGPNYFMPWSLYRCASENGVRIFLDGTDGDTTISHGMDYFDVLAQTGQWQEFSKEAKAVTRRFGNSEYSSVSGIFYNYGATKLKNLAREMKWNAFAKSVREVNRYLNIPQKKMIVNLGIKSLLPNTVMKTWLSIRGKRVPSYIPPNTIMPAFSNMIRSDMMMVNGNNHTSSRINKLGNLLHFEHLRSGMLTYSLELINRLSSAFSLEVSFPFCDRKLVEFCLAVPPEQKLHHGWSRYYFRNAMAGILPERVRWRPGKISLSKVYPYMLNRYSREFVEETLNHPPEIATQYINFPVIREMYRQFLTTGQSEDLSWVWQTIVFVAWFKQTRFITA